MKTTIDGAIITDDMLEQIRDWQGFDNLDQDLETIDEAIDLVLEQDDVSDLACKNAIKYLHLITHLRALAKRICKFKPENEDVNEWV